MNLRFMKTEIFALNFLFFLSFISVNAQIDSSIYQLPAGTLMRVSMDNEINSKVASAGDTFTTTLAAPVVIRETVVLPIGTIIEGRVAQVKRAAFGRKGGILEVTFQTLLMNNGVKREIAGVLVKELKTENSQTTDVLTIIGGTAIGGILGAVSKVEYGGLIGAGVGAGTGASVAFLRKGKDVGIKTDEKFEIKLTRNVTLPVQDF